jgi:hypothetical protein
VQEGQFDPRMINLVSNVPPPPVQHRMDQSPPPELSTFRPPVKRILQKVMMTPNGSVIVSEEVLTDQNSFQGQLPPQQFQS